MSGRIHSYDDHKISYQGAAAAATSAFTAGPYAERPHPTPPACQIHHGPGRETAW